MIKIAAKDLKPQDIIFDPTTKTQSMVKTVAPSDDTHVKVTLYGQLAVYHENSKMLQITARPSKMKLRTGNKQ